jgi:hypothetical protein
MAVAKRAAIKKRLPQSRKDRQGALRVKWFRGYLLRVIGKEEKEAASSSSPMTPEY